MCVMASGERETKDQNSVQKNQLSLEEEHSGKSTNGASTSCFITFSLDIVLIHLFYENNTNCENTH